jgi:hypothetical protein
MGDLGGAGALCCVSSTVALDPTNSPWSSWLKSLPPPAGGAGVQRAAACRGRRAVARELTVTQLELSAEQVHELTARGARPVGRRCDSGALRHAKPMAIQWAKQQPGGQWGGGPRRMARRGAVSRPVCSPWAGTGRAAAPRLEPRGPRAGSSELIPSNAGQTRWVLTAIFRHRRRSRQITRKPLLAG